MFVQQNLKAPKNQYNSFGDYHYRSCEDIQEALKPLMSEVKAVLLVYDDIVMVGDRFYVKATAVFQDAESPEKISNTAFARETESKPKMDAAQITGSCSSYARKYALNGLFCIDDAKDPDSMKNDQQDNKGSSQHGSRGSIRQQSDRSTQTGSARNNTTGSSALYVTQAHINTIRAEISRTGCTEKSVCERYKLNSLGNMTIEQFKKAMAILKKMSTKQPEPEQYDQMTFDEIAQYENEVPFA